MARYPDEWLEELIYKNDIVDVVSEKLPLTKRGGRYWGSCPWHSEKKPSFSVRPDAQMYYCFSCKRSGGVIKFIEEYERKSFTEAVEELAERVGMEIPADTGGNRGARLADKKRLCALMRDAAVFYHERLASPEGQACLKYFEGRGIAKQINPFGLGFAPERPDALNTFLKEKGYTVKEMLDAGVVKQNKNGIYDAFRGRAMFPIQNAWGDVIAFGGRVLGDGEPKYLNSQETLIFNKRRNLYALNLVKKRKPLNSVVLVEGYVDVVSLAAAGINRAVASLGTSFTKEQAQLLQRSVKEVYLCYDGDNAGQEANFKAVSVLMSAGLFVKVIVLPEGLDPDDFVRKHGSSGFYELAKKAMEGTEFQLSRIKRGFDMKDGAERARYAERATAHIASLSNELEKERLITLISLETGFSTDALKAQMNKRTSQGAAVTAPLPTAEAPDDIEARLIALLITAPSAATGLTLLPEDIEDEGFREIYLFLINKLNKGFYPVYDEIITEFEERLPRQAGLIAACAAAEEASPEEAFRRLASGIRKKRLTKKREELLYRAQSAEGEERMRLIFEASELSKELAAMRKTV